MIYRLAPVSAGLVVAIPFGLASLYVEPALAVVEIVPHQAIYEMTLGDIRVGAEINNVSGRMLFRWADACEGWQIEQRYVLEFGYAEGETVSLTSNYETWEAKDGSAFNFTYKTKTNGQESEDVQGVASLPGGGSIGMARFGSPERQDESLPGDTFFPTAHTVELIQNAADGVRFFSARLFDGTDIQSSIELSAVIGHAAENGAAQGRTDVDALDQDALAVREALNDVRSWPVQLAFFSADQQLLEPEYEMSMQVFENGIVDHLVIDYGDFQINGRLATLERITDGGC